MQQLPTRNHRDLVQPDAARHTFSSFLFLRPQRFQQSRPPCRNISSHHLILSRSTNNASRFGVQQSIAVSGGAAVSALRKSTSPATTAGCVAPVKKTRAFESPQQSKQAMWRTPLLYLLPKHDSSRSCLKAALRCAAVASKCGCAPSVDLHLSLLGSEHGFTT
jgi:hypothetical protein